MTLALPIANIPSSEDDALLAIALTMQPEIVRVTLLAAIEACAANGIAAGVQPVNPRMLTKFYPRESSKFLIASQRISRWYGYSPLTAPKDMFQTALAQAKEATLLFAANGFLSTAKDRADVLSLAEDWRSTCLAGSGLLRALHVQLIAFPQAATALQETDLLGLLDDVMAGGWPLLQADGTIDMPPWAERRQFNRVPVRCPAVLIGATKCQNVIIRDLSPAGVGLETSSDLSVGEPVFLRSALTLRLTGTVTWSNSRRAAVSFSKPLFSDDPLLKFCSASSPAAEQPMI
jgi:hypothetical protein